MPQEARTPHATLATAQEDPAALSQLLLDDEESDGQEQDASELRGTLASRWKGRRRARNDRYDEVELLRHKVLQMEEELRALRLQHLDTVVPVSSGPALAFSSRAFGFPLASPQAPAIWDLAARQQRWRDRAVRENTRLRAVLDSQANLARSMEAQLGERIREQLAGQTPFGDSMGVDRGPDFALETDTAESLRRGLDTAFEELDTVFGSNGLGRAGTPYTDARIRQGASGLYLDISANRLLPFDFETIATAAWNHYRGVERRRGNLHQNLTQEGQGCADTVVEEVAMKFSGKSTNADFRVKQALRRYVDADRQVVVWVSKADAVEHQASAYSNFTFVDKGYVVVKRPALSEQDPSASTLLQICCLISPQMARGCVLDMSMAGAFTEFVLSVMVASITATQELVEGMLVEEAQQLLQQRGSAKLAYNLLVRERKASIGLRNGCPYTFCIRVRATTKQHHEPQGNLGLDTELAPAGHRVVRAIALFVEKLQLERPVEVWTSPMKRARKTTSYVPTRNLKRYVATTSQTRRWLRGPHVRREIEHFYPKHYAAQLQDKLGSRCLVWVGGESYVDA